MLFASVIEKFGKKESIKHIENEAMYQPIAFIFYDIKLLYYKFFIFVLIFKGFANEVVCIKCSTFS